MTDTEQKRIKEICKVANVDDISDLSDGYHTFKQLYYQRMILFAVIVKQNRDKAWKSLRHEDGELCFGGGWFIVGIDTPEGSYTYHYEDTYFNLFDCEELERGKTWDGHTEKDVIRLLSLEQEPCEDCISRRAIKQKLQEHHDFFVNAYGGFSNLSQNDKSRVDEITNCIAMVVNEPSVISQPKTGKWIYTGDYITDGMLKCSSCGYEHDVADRFLYCPNCGAKMQEVEE